MIYEPGVYTITNEQYHSSQGISRSAIMKFKKTPLHYWHEYLNPEFVRPEQTVAMLFGSLLHDYLLGTVDEFNQMYAVQPFLEPLPKVPLLRDVGREIYDLAKSKRAGQESFNDEIERIFELDSRSKTVVSQWMIGEIVSMSKALMNRTQVAELLTGAQNETSIYWIDQESGLTCKARPDVWHSNMIVDLKTTADASYKACQASIFKYGYATQAAMMIDGIKAATGKEINNFINLFVEKEEPYAHAIYVLDEECIEAGRKEYKSILMKIRERFTCNVWPSYTPSTISLPKWADSD